MRALLVIASAAARDLTTLPPAGQAGQGGADGKKRRFFCPRSARGQHYGLALPLPCHAGHLLDAGLAFCMIFDHLYVVMIDELTGHAAEIGKLCMKHRVSRVEVFGSSSTGDFDPDTSDIDLIAEFQQADQPGYSDRFFDFATDLERLLGRPVDLLTPAMISNPFFRASVEASAQPIYVATDPTAHS